MTYPISITRNQLLIQTRAYLDACERDFEAAQARLDKARRILHHLSEGKPCAMCPTPELNETAPRADRFAARVDALLMASYVEETNNEE